MIHDILLFFCSQCGKNCKKPPKNCPVAYKSSYGRIGIRTKYLQEYVKKYLKKKKKVTLYELSTLLDSEVRALRVINEFRKKGIIKKHRNYYEVRRIC